MVEKCTIPRQKIKKKFWGGGTAPSPDPCPIGEGTPLPKPHPLCACRRLDTRAFGARYVPPFENPGSAPGLFTFLILLH